MKRFEIFLNCNERGGGGAFLIRRDDHLLSGFANWLIIWKIQEEKCCSSNSPTVLG